MPDPVHRDVALWQMLLDDAYQPLREAAAQTDATRPSGIMTLRRRWDQPLVHAALELAAARRKAIMKFPTRPDIVADVAGVEQATSSLVAAHKSHRFQQSAIEHVHDLCCGIGGDAIELSAVASITAIDRDPLRCWMASRNAACLSRTMDVRDLNMKSVQAFHVDPARRDEHNARRVWQYEDYQPAPAVLEEMLETCPNAAIKLGPGINISALPLRDRELEFITERNRLVQAVLWSGSLALRPNMRTATRLPGGGTISGAPSMPPLESQGRWLYEPDASLERAELLGVLCDSLHEPIGELHPGLGLLTSTSCIDSPWLRRFEIVDLLSWRIDRVRDVLRAHNAGIITVKTRGVRDNPDAIQRTLRGKAHTPLTLFITRLGERKVAIITRPPASKHCTM